MIYETHDPRFGRMFVGSAALDRLWTGARWAEGPVWFGDLNCLLFSDIPNQRILRWSPDALDGAVSVFRSPSNFANGHTRDREGRLVSCEHGTRRVTRTEIDGSVTVIADSYRGKRLNSEPCANHCTQVRPVKTASRVRNSRCEASRAVIIFLRPRKALPPRPALLRIDRLLCLYRPRAVIFMAISSNITRPATARTPRLKQCKDFVEPTGWTRKIFEGSNSMLNQVPIKCAISRRRTRACKSNLA